MADITSNLKGWWKGDEGSGTSAADSSGSGLTGTLSSAGWAAGKIGPNCFDLSGGKSISIGTSDTLNITGTALTLAGWVYPTSAANYYRIIERGGTYPSLQFSLVIEQTTAKVIADISPNVNSSFKTSTALTLNTWMHVAAVYDGSFIDIYLNGVRDVHLSASGSIASFSGSPCYIGRYTGATGLEWPGKLDDIRAYARALVQADITALYNWTGVIARRTQSGRLGTRTAA